MATAEIIVLVGSILKEVVGIIAAALAGTGAQTPEDLRNDLHGIIDRHDDVWLKAAVAEADAKFNTTPGKE